MALSGNIFATDKPFPTQKARTPPSRYIWVIAPPIARAPRAAAWAVPEMSLRVAPLISGGRVIKKTLRRSKGAVHVRDTENI